VFKQQFAILTSAPEYDMDIQAVIPPALATVHNFILNHDSAEVEEMPDLFDTTPGMIPDGEHEFGNLAHGPPT
jgi:hypothetical protein